jgi:hypothetical protein
MPFAPNRQPSWGMVEKSRRIPKDFASFLGCWHLSLLASEASSIPLKEVQKEFRIRLREVTIEGKLLEGMKIPV